MPIQNKKKAARPAKSVPARSSKAPAKGAPAKKSLVHTGGDFWKSQEDEQARLKHKKELREKGLDKVFRHWLKPGEEVEVIILDSCPEEMITRREHELRNPTGKAPFYEPCVVDAGLNCPVCSKFKESYFGVFFTILIPNAYEDKETGEWRNARRLITVKSGQGPTFKRILNAAMKEHGTTRGVTLLLQRGSEEKSAKIGEPVEYEDTGKRYGFLTEDELEEYANDEIKTREGKVIVEAGVDIQPLDYEALFDTDKDPSEILADLEARYGDGAAAGSAREVAESWKDDEAPDDEKPTRARATRNARPVRSTQPAVAKRRSRVRDEAPAEPEEAEEEADGASPTWSELGALADYEDDDDAKAQLEEAAAELELDPMAYSTWEELGNALDEHTGEDAEQEGEDEEQSVAALGLAADEGDNDAATLLTNMAEEADLDPNDYPTWAELAEALESEDAEDAEEESYEDIGTRIDNGDEDEESLIETLTEAAGDLDPNDYATWAEFGAAIDAGTEEESEEEEVEEDTTSRRRIVRRRSSNDEDDELPL